ncbi:exodeoxyribonuclease VII small subunit [Megasphaera cerevisiae DSM 20462]|jgi:exodeoxyribonuclease VII small subunit|uniref:Exodeoxyribonuclease 7 small subunit n=1 Tax=Megasphaera cerevisiae DSM 20462 TaxID=1122219 RepID=A0A0J6WXT7_9FIRM|nr:exodeoxyribonuclease VII small subunit [Megasphaera cerevisiae]KMO86657.1 exodeoxyribonuclease VII small subunit [Megasphaera cerevisiae DSM 20462]MCI1750462.1 exodeoxyribonuclease VII small subunit [Megasphaera cerevisiae]OKY52726.1 exodeoxyribonuclease VII small subunit [Megasphaera cerevisiae]SJZ88099.1 Exodeoxyribonuclease VII small subunit [Megasphaera cerevisiae DSM 20462]
MVRTTDKLKNFEANYGKLEELVKALDAPDLTLKESLDLFEKAIKLSQSCESALEYARQRAQALAEVHAAGQDTEETAVPEPEEGTLDL